MAYCIFYQIEQLHRPQSREVTSTWRKTTSGFVYIPYCTHPSGELSLSNIKFCAGSTDRLKCQGNVSSCQLENGPE